jgi:FtsH-binding integral membrane protein
MKENHVSIWFLIGLQLAIFGVLTVGAGIYGLFYPSEQTTVLEDLHPAIWWGAVMLLLGLFYSFKFRPGKISNTPKIP